MTQPNTQTQHKHKHKHVKNLTPKCPDLIHNQKGNAICIHNLEAPTYCRNPCPYKAATTSSEAKHGMLPSKLKLSFSTEKKPALSPIQHQKNIPCFNIEAEGVAL